MIVFFFKCGSPFDMGGMEEKRHNVIDPLMGLFRGAVFHHGGVPENCANGAFPPLLNGPFSDLNGPFSDLLTEPFSLLKFPGKQPIKQMGHEEVLDNGGISGMGFSNLIVLVSARPFLAFRVRAVLWNSGGPKGGHLNLFEQIFGKGMRRSTFQ